MRFLLMLGLTLFCAVSSFAQTEHEDQVILSSITTSERFLMPITDEPIMVIRGNKITAAKGYELVYSSSTDMVWSQPQGANFSSEQMLEAKKKKDKKKKDKKKKKGKGGGSTMTVNCMSSTACSCELKNVGTEDSPR